MLGKFSIWLIPNSPNLMMKVPFLVATEVAVIRLYYFKAPNQSYQEAFLTVKAIMNKFNKSKISMNSSVIGLLLSDHRPTDYLLTNILALIVCQLVKKSRGRWSV